MHKTSVKKQCCTRTKLVIVNVYSNVQLMQMCKYLLGHITNIAQVAVVVLCNVAQVAVINMQAKCVQQQRVLFVSNALQHAASLCL